MWKDAQPVGAANKQTPFRCAGGTPLRLALTHARIVVDFPVPAVPVMITRSGG